GATAAEGWTKQWRRLADRILQGFTAVFQLPAQARSRSEDQVGVIVGVVAYDMPGVSYGARDRRLLTDILADQKKCRPGLVPGQHVEQVQRVRIVGTVVEGYRH